MTMIERRSVNIYGYISLVVILALLALVWFQLVPKSMYMPLFGVAVVLYLIRITLRLLLERQRRIQEREKAANAGPVQEERKEGQ